MQPEGSVGVVAGRQEHLNAAALEWKRGMHMRLIVARQRADAVEAAVDV